MTPTGRRQAPPNLQTLPLSTIEVRLIREALFPSMFSGVTLADKLDALTGYFGGHEELQTAIYNWRLRRVGTNGVWMPKMFAVVEMYDTLIVDAGQGTALTKDFDATK